jgi:CBS domain containing-hemolysin-like protein
MPWFPLALVVLLAGVSISLSVIESAYYSLRRRRLGHLAQGNRRTELANRYMEDPPALLMPIHIGTYTAHVGMTAVVTWLLHDSLERWAVLAAMGFMLAFLLVCRTWLPWSMTWRNPERALLALMPAFHLYARLLAPLVRALRQTTEIGETDEELRDSGLPPPPPVQERDEVRLVGSLERFSQTQVREVMTPRPDVESIAADEPVSELRRVLRESKYSRVPVFGENLDDIVGIVSTRDLLEFEGPDLAPVRQLARPIFLVPETKLIADLLKELQARQLTLAVVIDEYGGTAGVVSVEDIVEEIVGEIKDEYDVETEPIAVDADGSWLVSGRLSLDRLEEYLEAELDDGSEVETVGGLATAVFGRVPRVGESAEHRGYTIEVVDAERKRVNRLRFTRRERVGA